METVNRDKIIDSKGIAFAEHWVPILKRHSDLCHKLHASQKLQGRLCWARDFPIPAEHHLPSLLLAPGICHCFPCSGPAPGGLRVRGRSLACALVGFTCVLTEVKATFWEVRNMSLYPFLMSLFPHFLHLPSLRLLETHRHHVDQALQTNVVHTWDRTMPTSTFGSFHGWRFICVWLVHYLFFRAGIVLNFCAMCVVGHLTKIS